MKNVRRNAVDRKMVSKLYTPALQLLVKVSHKKSNSKISSNNFGISKQRIKIKMNIQLFQFGTAHTLDHSFKFIEVTNSLQKTN